MLGEHHPDTATSLNNLAELLRSQGDYAAAKPLYEQALAIDKEALGEKHPGYATDLNNLALLLQAQGDCAAARPLFEQALAINKAVLGAAPPRHRHQPEQPGVAAPGARGTTPLPSPSTSRPWRSARRCWARATPPPPPA